MPSDTPSPQWRARIIETQAFALIEQEAGEAGEFPPILCIGFDYPGACSTIWRKAFA
jgi:hypothetical protein